MGKCKNTECNNETTGKKVYCSLTCRNVFVNKHLRDYTKNGAGLSKIPRESYESNPKYCVNPKCNKKLPFNKRRNKYCDSSCSASHTNIGRVMTEESNKKRRDKLIKNILINCKNCNKEFLKKRRRLFCSNICRTEYDRKDMDEYQLYKSECQFKFSLNDFPDEFDFSMVEKYGWYKAKNRGDNLNGVSRDHKLSIREGFDLGVDPKIISHPANCQLMSHNDNVSKNKKSDITEEKLKSLIKEWDKKYK